MKIVNINLDFYYELCYHKVKESDKLWKLFTIENEEDLDSLVKEEELLLSHQKKLLYLSDSEEYKKMIMNEDIERNAMIEQNYGYLYTTGIEQGSLNTKKEIVLQMFNDNVSIDLISKYTGLSKKEIEAIVNNK